MFVISDKIVTVTVIYIHHNDPDNEFAERFYYIKH